MKKTILSTILFGLLVSGCQAVPTTNPPPVLSYKPGNVLYVATNGVDVLAARGVSTAPFATITAAITAAQPGDKIIVSAGTFTGNSGTITLPVGAKLIGSGTNSTACDIVDLRLSNSNEVSGISFTNRSGSIGQGQIRTVVGGASYCFLHELVIKSLNQCLTIGGTSGYNVISNCVFDTQAWGVDLLGTNYFYNCWAQKLTDNPSITQGSRMVNPVAGGTWTYWSGGKFLSVTNCAGDAGTNTVMVWSGDGSSQTFIQNIDFQSQSPSLNIFGVAGSTNHFGTNVTWNATRTNAVAVIVVSSNSVVVPNVSHQDGQFVPIWFVPNTNAPFVLTPP